MGLWTKCKYICDVSVKCLNKVVSVSQPVIVVAPLAVEHKLNICEVGAPCAAHSPHSVQVSGYATLGLYIWWCYTTTSQGTRQGKLSVQLITV